MIVAGRPAGRLCLGRWWFVIMIVLLNRAPEAFVVPRTGTNRQGRHVHVLVGGHSSYPRLHHGLVAHDNQDIVRPPSIHRFASPTTDTGGETVTQFQSNTDSTQSSSSSFKLMLEDMEPINRCRSATEARRILEKALKGMQSSLSSSSAQAGSDQQQSVRSPLYQSVCILPDVSSRTMSDAELAIQTRQVNKKYGIMELIDASSNRDIQRASLGLLVVFLLSTCFALVAQQYLPGPDYLRFLVVWLFTFAPLAYVGYGYQNAKALQQVLVSIQRKFFPAYRKRMIQHEAGHLVMAHLLGWPVARYDTDRAIQNAIELYPLADPDHGWDAAQRMGFDPQQQRGRQQSQPSKPWTWLEIDDESQPLNRFADAPFFSKDGRGGNMIENQSVFRREAKNYTSFLHVPSRMDPSTVWPYRPLSESALDQLAVISVAGMCAEILSMGNAQGGAADLQQLRQFFAAAGIADDAEQIVRGRGDEKNNGNKYDREMQNRVRFAISFALTSLRGHMGALDAVAAVMERGGTVAECVYAMETCHNVRGFPEDGTVTIAEYEYQRRQNLLRQPGAWLERVFMLLGNSDWHIDTTLDNKARVQGKGGGNKQQTFRLTGDDPLYAALFVAAVFLTWASSGGLSLH